NVDFYSATVYHSLGIPTDLFTPIFAIARTAGWTAHVLEQLEDNRLYRPLSEYIGEPAGKKVVPLDDRPQFVGRRQFVRSDTLMKRILLIELGRWSANHL